MESSLLELLTPVIKDLLHRISNLITPYGA